MGSYDGVVGFSSLCFKVPFPQSAGFERSLCLLPDCFSAMVVGRCTFEDWPCANGVAGVAEKERYHSVLKEGAETNALASTSDETIQPHSYLLLV